MHARLNRFTGMDGDALAQSFDWFAGEGLPRLRRAASFTTIFFGVDLPGGKATGLTIWDSQRALKVSERVEAQLRAEALRRAGGNLGRGLVDTYEVVFADTDLVDADEPNLTARLSRWEGLTPGTINWAQEHFVAHELPYWQEHPAYRGELLGANRFMGNTFGVSLWATSDLKEVTELERMAVARLSSARSGPFRPVYIDTYQVALAPQVPVAAKAA
jgi:hypothetical protein